MAGVNKGILVGHLGRDPEVRYMQDGRAVTTFSIATSESWKDKNTGETVEKTEWHRIVAFNRLGEICKNYLTVGQQVYIEGKIRTRSWEKDGITRYTTEIVADHMQMLSRSDRQPEHNHSATAKSAQKPIVYHEQKENDDLIPF